jgi:hypothetical protein
MSGIGIKNGSSNIAKPLSLSGPTLGIRFDRRSG